MKTMRYLVAILCIFLLADGISAAAVSVQSRKQRSVAQFVGMIFCIRRNPLKYDGYGCYCGFGGSGTPVDAIDRCCKAHDLCYGRALEIDDCNPYFVTYSWQCNNKMPTCHDSATSSPCAAKACECDKAAVECFEDNNSVYNEYYNAAHPMYEFEVQC